MTELYEIIVKSAKSAYSLLDPKTGSMPSGHNGGYYDLETPVRNTSHWLITFLKVYSISQDKQFLKAAQLTTKYLCSQEARPMNATFWHRKNPEKDSCNGLIGQAWTIEALVTAAQQLEMPELLDIAEKVFLLHPFDETTGLWRRVGVDGTYLSVDMTFNHQLWFAAAGSLLSKYVSAEVETRVRRFMEKLSGNFDTYPSGLIRHLVALDNLKLKKKLNIRFKRLKLLKQSHKLTHKEIGYHSFNLYAFGLLKQTCSDFPIWQSKRFKSALDYAQSPKYWNAIQNNQFGYPYNPPGFETAFALKVFCQNEQLNQEKWISQQLSRCYDFEANLMNKNTKDPATLAARLYEATRLSNLELKINN